MPIPSERAVSISFQPSSSGSIRSSTQTSGFSKRSRASPTSPRPTTIGSSPAADEVARHPVGDDAVVLDDQDLGHVPTIVPCRARNRLRDGDDLVNERSPEQGSAGAPANAETRDRLDHDRRGTPPEDVSFDELRMGFTAAVSHELRTPLARILALIDSAELPGADVLGAARRRARRGRARRRADRRDPLSLASSRAAARSSRSATPTRCPCSRRWSASCGRAATRAGARRCAPTAIPTSTCRSARACCASSPRTWPRTRSATPAAARRFTLSVEREPGDRTVLRAVDDGVGVGAARPAPPLRALLARRRRARLARHRARARDRQARRHRRRRHDRGGQRARPGAEHPLQLPGVSGGATRAGRLAVAEWSPALPSVALGCVGAMRSSTRNETQGSNGCRRTA